MPCLTIYIYSITHGKNIYLPYIIWHFGMIFISIGFHFMPCLTIYIYSIPHGKNIYLPYIIWHFGMIFISIFGTADAGPHTFDSKHCHTFPLKPHHLFPMASKKFLSVRTFFAFQKWTKINVQNPKVIHFYKHTFLPISFDPKFRLKYTRHVFPTPYANPYF